MIDEHLQELEEFWDDFAEDYEQIQQESRFPIAKELKQFLLEQLILPAGSFLDLAGGSGRYFAELQDSVKQYTLVDISKEMLAIAKTKQQNADVAFVHQDQDSFFQTNSQTYDVVFTAMNPVLLTREDLLAFTAQSHNWCLIFRLVEEKDSLFSPYEEPDDEAELMSLYQQLLTEEKFTFYTKEFLFTSHQEVSRDFFEAYFEAAFSEEQLQDIADRLFGKNDRQTNFQTVKYQLIYYQNSK